MSDFLEAASDWLTSLFAEQVSKSATYSRGASSVAIDVTLGGSRTPVVDAAGQLVEVESIDFLFRAAALDFGAGPVLPAEGDTIAYRGKTYEVLSPGGERHYQETDPYGHGLRVHTKLIEE